MIRVIALALAFALLASAAACGGNDADPDRLLQLRYGQFTERVFRSLLVESIANQDEEYEIVCAALGGLSDDEAVEVSVLSYSIARPDQEIVVADEKRSVQIMREECEAAGLS